jgi:hypothetical protein
MRFEIVELSSTDILELQKVISAHDENNTIAVNKKLVVYEAEKYTDCGVIYQKRVVENTSSGLAGIVSAAKGMTNTVNRYFVKMPVLVQDVQE